jgi:hypothetical protein
MAASEMLVGSLEEDPGEFAVGALLNGRVTDAPFDAYTCHGAAVASLARRAG